MILDEGFKFEKKKMIRSMDVRVDVGSSLRRYKEGEER